MCTDLLIVWPAGVLDELRDRKVMAVIAGDREKIAQSLRGKGHDVLEADPTLRKRSWTRTSSRRRR